MTLALLAAPHIADAQQAPDPRVADLVRAGKVRVGLFPPQYTKEPGTGELRGVYVNVFRAFAARIGVELVLVEHPTPPKMVECLKAGVCDVGSLGFDPARAADVEGFSPPFLEFDYTYLVPAGSSIRNIADADRPGVRIAVVHAHASTLILTRIRKQAELVSVDTPDSAFELLRTGRVDAWASARPALVDYSAQLPGSHVLDARYGANRPALVHRDSSSRQSRAPAGAELGWRLRRARKPRSERPSVHIHIETERLRLRVWEEADRHHFATLNADPIVMRDLGGPLKRDESDAKLDRYLEAWGNNGYGRWLVETIKGKFLGYCGVMPVRENHPIGIHDEIGWRLIHEAWGHGYATEAARAALIDAFRRVRLREVVAYTDAQNIRSQAVMKRLGLRRDASRDFAIHSDRLGTWRGLVWTAHAGLLRERSLGD